MKEFNLEAAKNGTPVCLRDGRRARIVCFDFSTSHRYPIIALVRSLNDDRIEEVEVYSIDGKHNCQSSMDLMMDVGKHKRKGFVNIYRSLHNTTCGRNIYKTPEIAAFEASKPLGLGKHIATVKIEWEEEL